MKFLLTIETKDTEILSWVACIAKMIESYAMNKNTEKCSFDPQAYSRAAAFFWEAFENSIRECADDWWQVTDDTDQTLAFLGRSLISLGQFITANPRAQLELARLDDLRAQLEEKADS